MSLASPVNQMKFNKSRYGFDLNNIEQSSNPMTRFPPLTSNNAYERKPFSISIPETSDILQNMAHNYSSPTANTTQPSVRGDKSPLSYNNGNYGNRRE